MRKLLRIRPKPGAEIQLEIHFVSEGKWNGDLQREGSDGCTVWGLGDDGRRRAKHYESMTIMVEHLTRLPSV